MRVAYNTKSGDPQVERYQALCKEFFDIADVACETESVTEMLFNHLKSLHTPIGQCCEDMQNQSDCPTPVGTIHIRLIT